MNESIRLRFGKELIKQAAEKDFLIFNADTKSCGIEKFGEMYPERNFTFGIAEQNLMAAAAGAALSGEKVFLATFAVFASMRACEQVRTFICYPKLDVTILASHGGLQTGADGASHIAVEDISILRSIPNITIVEPSDYIAGELLVKKAIGFHGPLYIRFPKEATPCIHDKSYNITIGKANIIKDGHDVTLIASGWILSKAIEAADILKSKGIDAAVIEMHTIKPLDNEAVLNTAKRTGVIVTIEDNTILGGLGSAVMESLSDTYPIPVIRIGILDQFGESGIPDLLYKKNKMSVDNIVDAAYRAIDLKENRLK